MRPVLTAEFMSSDESNAEEVSVEQDPASSDESDHDQEHSTATLKKKKA